MELYLHLPAKVLNYHHTCTISHTTSLICSIRHWQNIHNYVFHTPYVKNMIKQSTFINTTVPHTMAG